MFLHSDEPFIYSKAKHFQGKRSSKFSNQFNVGTKRCKKATKNFLRLFNNAKNIKLPSWTLKSIKFLICECMNDWTENEYFYILWQWTEVSLWHNENMFSNCVTRWNIFHDKRSLKGFLCYQNCFMVKIELFCVMLYRLKHSFKEIAVMLIYIWHKK